ncbi:SMI1/KNR4 family protein [Streptomyces lavendulae]|uniref:SMI1/KNR4 family protein n=1 Tax=Streptomyces lavendulae TaxID=1914 RepID=UPI0034105776
MNGDVMAAQTPVVRLTDPYEALAALEEAVPGLAELRRAEPARVDWAAAEARLGTLLPGDFKLLAEVYPDLHFGDYMSLHTPWPGEEEAWAGAAAEEEEDVADLIDLADLGAVLAAYPAPGGLLTWGSSNQGDTFLWTTEGTGPEAWKVTVASRSGDWWHYNAGAVQFTADLISGALEPWGLPRVRPEVVALGGEAQTGERAPQVDGG